MHTGTSQETTTGGLVEHWRWRPDWSPDRVCLWWYLTFHDQPAVGNLAARVADQLEGSPSIDIVPRDWLHLTVAEIGYADDITDDLVATLADQATARLKFVDEFHLRLGPVAILPGAVALEAHPRQAVETLRRSLPRCTPQLNDEGVPWPGPTEVPPHVSVGYVNTEGRRDEVTDRVTRTLSPVYATVRHVVLAAVTRHERHYQWTDLRTIRLRGSDTVRTGLNCRTES